MFIAGVVALCATCVTAQSYSNYGSYGTNYNTNYGSNYGSNYGTNYGNTYQKPCPVAPEPAVEFAPAAECCRGRTDLVLAGYAISRNVSSLLIGAGVKTCGGEVQIEIPNDSSYSGNSYGYYPKRTATCIKLCCDCCDNAWIIATGKAGGAHASNVDKPCDPDLGNMYVCTEGYGYTAPYLYSAKTGLTGADALTTDLADGTFTFTCADAGIAGSCPSCPMSSNTNSRSPYRKCSDFRND